MLCLLGACILSAKITGGGTYTEKTPTVSIDNSNRVHSVSHFYKPENTQFKINGFLILDSLTRIDVNYDNGLKSQKRYRDKSLDIGIRQLKQLGKSDHVFYGASTKIGGKITNIPCRDDSGFERLFYCDNLSTLKPFKASEYIQTSQVFIKYLHRF